MVPSGELDMPRFFFHIFDQGEAITDEEGMDFPDIDSAIAEARHSARDFAAECVRSGVVVDGRKIVVQDSQGKTVLEYAVKDVIAQLSN
jgi:hypothetical protein